MAVRKLKPVTPGQRHKVIGTFEDITASVPEKSLVYGKRSTGGRNNTGKMTVRYIGGGHKQKYRLIDFKREKDGVPAVVKTIEYDPNRSARIALLYYADGEKRYIIAPNGLQVGATLMSGADAAPEIGNCLPLANIPVGTVIHNIELRPGQGALLVRSAGNFAQLTSREGSYCVIKLPSGETRQILSACKATVGSVGNSDHALEQSGKAGRSRWLGRRPHNRGVVMNPEEVRYAGRAAGLHQQRRAARTGIFQVKEQGACPAGQAPCFFMRYLYCSKYSATERLISRAKPESYLRLWKAVHHASKPEVLAL